jgi:hypothetical protein
VTALANFFNYVGTDKISNWADSLNPICRIDVCMIPI